MLSNESERVRSVAYIFAFLQFCYLITTHLILRKLNHADVSLFFYFFPYSNIFILRYRMGLGLFLVGGRQRAGSRKYLEESIKENSNSSEVRKCTERNG